MTERPPVEGMTHAAFQVYTPYSDNLLAIALRTTDTFILDVIREEIRVADASAVLKRYGISQVTGESSPQQQLQTGDGAFTESIQVADHVLVAGRRGEDVEASGRWR